ncbi:site-specific integrase [Brevibacillus laterosporus]|uniref:site-specific integrase n=1 Tax=Brevibacillus laterosporus TaxID=1465 RepID=UPI0018CE9A4C|nr:site-specific integrase [Brevibacillus laterosporus]MBG9786618.1 integrase [Brevibacillus laterosporus]
MASIERRGKDSFRLIVEVGYDANGKRIKRTKTIKGVGKREAEKELAKFIMEVESGEYIAPEKMTLATFVDEWKEKYAKRELAPKTLENYLIQINNRILPEFGHMRLDQIKPLHIITFINKLQGEGIRNDNREGKLSSSMIEYIHKVLKNIFNRAVEWKVIKKHPMESLKKPKVEQEEMSVYEEEEIRLLFIALEKESLMWRTMVTLALTCGLRRGELLALEWDNVNFEESYIYIKQSLSYSKESGYLIKEPKTKNSKRKVSIPLSIIPDLKELKKQAMKDRLKAEELWEGGERFFVFTSWHGKPLYPSSVKTWWSRFTKRHALRYIRFHDLRHTSATLLINQGVHTKIVSQRLGHAKTSTTNDIYAHVLLSADKETAKHFDSLLQNISAPKNA